ncbi:MAG: response regulator transcription factor [Chloroflexi bacterium]|nr:response regulator transcription factor [Chloroflexota bacterium]
MTESMINVMLVDDHDVVRQGVRTYLDLQPDIAVVAEAASGEQALERIAEHAPDVVLMDLIMPGGMDGVETTRRLKAISPRTQVIVLTSYHEDEHIFSAIRAGALSYLLKSIKAPQLAEAIRKAANGEATLDAQVAARIVQEVHGSRLDDLNPFTELTDREMEVLRLIAQGLQNADIAEELTITIKTVRAHASNILAKLHLQDRTQAAVYAWREGIVRRDNTEDG